MFKYTLLGSLFGALFGCLFAFVGWLTDPMNSITLTEAVSETWWWFALMGSIMGIVTGSLPKRKHIPS